MANRVGFHVFVQWTRGSADSFSHALLSRGPVLAPMHTTAKPPNDPIDHPSQEHIPLSAGGFLIGCQQLSPLSTVAQASGNGVCFFAQPCWPQGPDTLQFPLALFVIHALAAHL